MIVLMTTGDSLLSAIEAFCKRHSMSETAFGLKAARDGHLVRRLRDTRSITLRRIEKVEQFMRDHPDENAVHEADPSHTEQVAEGVS